MLESFIAWLKQLGSGKIPLGRMFWLYGIVGSVLCDVISALAYYLSVIPELTGRALVLTVHVSALVYQIFVLIGIWLSAGRYAGKKIWAFLARLFVILSVVMGLLAVKDLLQHDTYDPNRNSTNAIKTLKRDPNYPLAGFWKQNCIQNSGLLIEPSEVQGKYAISFCGARGCFGPGTSAYDNPIVEDPHLYIVDENTIRVRSPKGFDKYIRCE